MVMEVYCVCIVCGEYIYIYIYIVYIGPEVARFVEKHFPEELIKNENFEQGNYPESLSETLIQMDYLLETDEGHTEVKEYALETVNKKIDEELGTVVETRGCTATVALLVNENIYIANTGDCRLIISRGRGNVEQITIDQKPELEEEKKRVEKAGGVIMNGRIDGDINVSRSLGDFRYKNNTQLSREEQKLVPYPDIFSISRDGVDFLLIGCDGIYEMMDNSQLMEFIYAQYAEGVKDLETIVGLMIDKLVSPGPKKG